jgi:hypothetical protein
MAEAKQRNIFSFFVEIFNPNPHGFIALTKATACG